MPPSNDALVDLQALAAACRQLALAVQHASGRADDDAVRRLAEAYFAESLPQAEYLLGQGRDPRFVIEAVRYLAQVQASPAAAGDPHWFTTAMDVLVQLACPIRAITGTQMTFFDDIQFGIEEARGELLHPPATDACRH